MRNLNGYIRLSTDRCGTCLNTLVVQHAEKANAQIGTFGFCRPLSQTQKTKRAYFFAYARTDQQGNERNVY